MTSSAPEGWAVSVPLLTYNMASQRRNHAIPIDRIRKRTGMHKLQLNLTLN